MICFEDFYFFNQLCLLLKFKLESFYFLFFVLVWMPFSTILQSFLLTFSFLWSLWLTGNNGLHGTFYISFYRSLAVHLFHFNGTVLYCYGLEGKLKWVRWILHKKKEGYIPSTNGFSIFRVGVGSGMKFCRFS